MKAIPIIAAFVLGILVACAPSTQTTTQSGAPITPRADGKQAKLAVLSFSGQNGRELSDSLNTALFRTGRFILLEREGLSGLQSEASIGQNPTVFEGADVVVLGSITAFEPNAGGTGGGGVGISLPFIGGLKFGANEAYIAADLRIVEVKTRRILNIVKVEGRSSSFSVGGVGGGFLGPVFIGGSLGTYANQPMGKAIAVMLEAAVRDLAKGIPEVYYVDPTAAPVASNPKPASTPSTSTTSPSTSTTTAKPQAKPNGIQALPGNPLPFFDDFSNRPLGAALGVSDPNSYGLLYVGDTQKEGPGFAQIDQDTQGKKLLQINQGYFLTTGSEDWQDYKVSFDLAQLNDNGTSNGDRNADKDHFYVAININPIQGTRFIIDFAMNGTATLYVIDGNESKEVGRRTNANYRFYNGGFTSIEVISQKADIKVNVGGRGLFEYRLGDPRMFKGGVGFGGEMWARSSNGKQYWHPYYIRDLKIEALK
jgi:curli biogenesis system outer membrane secretion channel CsgG